MNGKTIFLILSAATMVLPVTNASAQNKPVIKSVDFTLPIPKPGESLFDAREFQFTSAKTEYGDLAPSGEIAVFDLDWIGDFNTNDDGDMFFRDGFSYKVRLKFMVNPNGKYTTDYVFTGKDYYIDGTRIKATVNGMDVKILDSVPYFINTEFTVKVGDGGAGSERAVAQRQKSDYELNKNSYRASLKAYSIAEADAANPDINPVDLIIITDLYKPEFYAGSPGRTAYLHQDCMRVTRMIVDTEDCYVASEVNNTIMGPYNIKEVWLSDKVDAVEFLLGICGAMSGGRDDKTGIYYAAYSMLFHSKRATLFIPEAAAPAIKARVSRPTWMHKLLFTIRTYTGDVYSAQKAGAAATKPFCTEHVFTDKVVAADKICKYADCKVGNRYYYSCRICGECEHNDNHLFGDKGPLTGTPELLAHYYEQPLADDQAYVGVNAAGHHVWWYSCVWCGHSYGYDQRHITKLEWKSSGTEANYAQFCQVMARQTEDREEEARLVTTAQPGMFILPYKSEAKMSPAFQSVVNFALNDNLLDDNALGDDYTGPINHFQLRSIAVRLAEELLGGEVKVNKKVRVRFVDDFSAKAATIGLLDGHFSGEGAPADTAPATRQEVVTIIYRVLRFIESQKVYSYTEYDSKLDSYADRGSIAPWAEEAVAFMDALGLVKPESASSFAPDAVFTIEQAIEVAEKSTHAQQLGWYQARSWGENQGRSYSGSLSTIPYAGGGCHFISPGERIWVVGPRLGGMWKFLPTIDCYTGQLLYVDAEWFRPVRPQVFTRKGTIVKSIQFQDYMDGVYMWDYGF